MKAPIGRDKRARVVHPQRAASLLGEVDEQVEALRRPAGLRPDLALALDGTLRAGYGVRVKGGSRRRGRGGDTRIYKRTETPARAIGFFFATTRLTVFFGTTRFTTFFGATFFFTTRFTTFFTCGATTAAVSATRRM